MATHTRIQISTHVHFGSTRCVAISYSQSIISFQYVSLVQDLSRLDIVFTTLKSIFDYVCLKHNERDIDVTSLFG